MRLHCLYKRSPPTVTNIFRTTLLYTIKTKTWWQQDIIFFISCSLHDKIWCFCCHGQKQSTQDLSMQAFIKNFKKVRKSYKVLKWIQLQMNNNAWHITVCHYLISFIKYTLCIIWQNYVLQQYLDHFLYDFISSSHWCEEIQVHSSLLY